MVLFGDLIWVDVVRNTCSFSCRLCDCSSSLLRRTLVLSSSSLELKVLDLPSTRITLVLWRVDFSVSSCDLPGGENMDGDIFKDAFQLKYFNLLR